MHFHHGYITGCIGRITEMHATFYARAVGFGTLFEAKVASELADFCLRYDHRRDGIWLALEGEAIHGSIVIDAAHYETEGAHLRWFIASDKSRGTGVGTRLIGAAMEFCREHNYRNVYLWTFDELHAARHLYEKYGFRLQSAQRGSQWGKEVNEQKFELGDA